MLFRSNPKSAHHQRPASKLSWRLMLPLGLVILLPILTYTTLEMTSLNEREALVQSLYQAQLGAILFSVNQHCWDIVSGWGSFLRTELSFTNFSEVGTHELNRRLTKVQQRYAAINGVFLHEQDRIQLVLADSFLPERERLIESIQATLGAHAEGLAKMKDQARKGYIRPLAISLAHSSPGGVDLLIVFALEANDEKVDSLTAGVLLASENFVRQVLGPKISEFASRHFLLAVKRPSNDRVVLATSPEVRDDFEYEEPLWILPDMSLAIKLAGASAAQIAAARSRRTLLLMLGIDVIILAAAVLLLRVIMREAELARLKSEFVDNVSHDLRTPLGVIRMFAETLEMGRVPSEEKKREYYGIIVRETARLARLVNNVLDFSRMEAGRNEYHFQTISLQETIREALESYRFHLERRGFALSEQIDPHLPAVVADAEAVAQAFLNLLDNAVKYSDQEKHIHVGMREENGWVVIEVTDRGLGIDARHLDKIFTKFYRIERVGLETRGAGIGLAMVKHIVTAHQGRVEVKSTPGKGSSFFLKFPLKSR